jgi:hypothetical protein
MSNPDEKLLYDTPERIAENFRRWRFAMEASHALLMAGLRDRVGPDGDVIAAYREWIAHHREQKLRSLEKSAERYWKRQNELKDNDAS